MMSNRTDRREGYYWSQVKKYGVKYPSFHWPSVEVLLSLAYTYDVVFGYISREIAPYGITRAGFGVLMILSRSQSKACKQNEISRLMLVSRSNITKLVDGLARQGLVRRTRDPRDRRVNKVKILARGEGLLEELLPGHYKHVHEICSVFTASEKKALNDLLTKLRNKMGKVIERIV